MIEPGTPQQIKWGDGNWIFLDIRFSGSQKTCGLVIGETTPGCVDFARLRVHQHVQHPLSSGAAGLSRHYRPWFSQPERREKALDRTYSTRPAG
jgi:hypothetical protein